MIDITTIQQQTLRVMWLRANSAIVQANNEASERLTRHMARLLAMNLLSAYFAAIDELLAK